jgi:hypothetical protein
MLLMRRMFDFGAISRIGRRGRRAALAVVLTLGGVSDGVAGQTKAPQPEPFEIMDNSFLVEEAFNQEAGIFQNILNGARSGGTWAATFTQEWPVVSQAHQFSYTLAWAHGPGGADFGDVLINYRSQALMEGAGRPAFSPRVSLVLPRGDFGNSPGLQFNLPFSKQTSDIYWHWNAGITLLPSAELAGESRSLESPFLAGSAIVRMQPMLHAMLESVLAFNDQPTAVATSRQRSFTLSPGLRGGWNIGDHQAVVGLAVPITWADDEIDKAAFLYFSYELPFKK